MSSNELKASKPDRKRPSVLFRRYSPIKYYAKSFRTLGFRAQLTTLTMIVLGVTLLLYSTVLYRNFISFQAAEFDSALFNYAVDVGNALTVNTFGEVVVSDEVFRANEKIFPFALERTVLQLRDMNGRTVAKSSTLGMSDIPTDLSMLENIRKTKTLFSSVRLEFRGKTANYRIVHYLIDQPGPRDFILQVASPLTLLEREKNALIFFFLLSIPATLIIVGLAAYFFSKQAVIPIIDIIQKAKEITARKLNERLPVPRVDDEISQLAKTLNELLDRLQEAFVSQESFVADASHQLKTPLAILRGEIDLIRRSTEVKSPAVMEFLESAHQEVGYLTRMVEQLLILAKIESGGAGFHFNAVRVDEVAIDVVSYMQRYEWVRKKGLRLSFNLAEGEKGEFTIHGDQDLIRTSLEALIDNAIKYSRDDSTISVEARDVGKEIEFQVKDSGEGFTEEDKLKLFNRFFRSAKIESSPIKGSGLGLSIVKKIADLHHARVEVHSTQGVGSSFMISFPKNPPQIAS